MASKKARGKRAKTRHKFRSKGKVSPNKILGIIKENSVVKISANSSFQSAMPFRRFHGKTGRVLEKRGSAYVVSVSDGKMEKKLILSPVHLNVTDEGN